MISKRLLATTPRLRPILLRFTRARQAWPFHAVHRRRRKQPQPPSIQYCSSNLDLESESHACSSIQRPMRDGRHNSDSRRTSCFTTYHDGGDEVRRPKRPCISSFVPVLDSLESGYQYILYMQVQVSGDARHLLPPNRNALHGTNPRPKDLDSPATRSGVPRFVLEVLPWLSGIRICQVLRRTVW
jgi:hypothetical protein